MKNKKIGFTLLEVLVVVIIIAVLAAIAVPMYKHAILKSRFSTVMPMAKAVADAQEIYYLGNNQYALGKEDLDIAPVEAENTQVALSSADEEDKYIYVAANRSDIPDVRYIMYQKNSPQFAGNIHCEAKADNDEALWLCEKGLHGTEVSGSGSLQGGTYKTFLLAGNQGNSTFLTCPVNAVCDEGGSVTGCESGYYLEEQTCKEEKACDETNKTLRTPCDENCGEEVKQGTCNTRTGAWDYTVTQACPQKPTDTTEPCEIGTGIITYEYKCNSTGTEWERKLVRQECTYAGVCSSTTTDSCSDYVFAGSIGQANCQSNSEGSCNNNEYYGGAWCYAGQFANSCNGGVYYKSGIEETNKYTTCSASANNSCNGAIFKEGTFCITYNGTTNTCNSTYEKGAYCTPGQNGAVCPKGTPADTTGYTCWDGSGSRGPGYCNS